MSINFIKPVYAHCDIPCGIYETDTMKHAADTCLRMVEKINELGKIDSGDKHNNFIRMVMTKEKQAAKVKRELYILWGDYFKPEHLEHFPDLHDIFWQTIKQTSRVKQTLNTEECQKLIDQIQRIDKIFKVTKK